MPDNIKKYYVYIILTVNNKLYCGYTNNVERRYKLHCEGNGAKFTRANKPLKLVYVKEFELKQDALREESRIKKLKRKEKEKLLSNETYWTHRHNNFGGKSFLVSQFALF